MPFFRSAIVATSASLSDPMFAGSVTLSVMFFGLLYSPVILINYVGFVILIAVNYVAFVECMVLTPALMAWLGETFWWPLVFDPATEDLLDNNKQQTDSRRTSGDQSETNSDDPELRIMTWSSTTELNISND